MLRLVWIILLVLAFLAFDVRDAHSVNNLPGGFLITTGIYLTEPGTVKVTSKLGELACREGTLHLHSPELRWPDSRQADGNIIIEDYGVKEEQFVIIGPYEKGTTLVFAISPGTSYCNGKYLLSTDNSHAKVTRESKNRWIISWEDHLDKDFNDLQVVVETPSAEQVSDITFTDEVTAVEAPFSKDPQYKLPWYYPGSHPVTEVPNQNLHTGANAYDFGGSFTVAAPERGQVLWVEDSFDPGRCDSSYAQRVNVIILQTAEDTQIAFVHLKRGSAKLEVGDVVEQGDKLAISGNSGFSCSEDGDGSHLHLEFQWACYSLEQAVRLRNQIKEGTPTFAWSCPTKKPYYSDGFWINGQFFEKLRKGVWYRSDNQ